MKYNRLTQQREAPLVMSLWEATKMYNRLAKLEDKIERGELISTVRSKQGEQETTFFVKHDAKVCEEVVKECLQVLHDTRMPYVHDDYSQGCNDSIDVAIERLAKRYDIDVR